MAEALGLTASVIAIAQLADRITDACKFYIESLEGCPRDLRLILVEISAIRAVLQNLEFIAKHGDDSSALLKTMEAPDGPIAGCLEAIIELETLISPMSQLRSGSRKRKRQMRDKMSVSLATLAWPLKKEKARSLLNDIGQYKTTISTILATESLQDIKDIKQSLRSVCDRLEWSVRCDISRWLQHTDPSRNHNAARELYEPGTGEWVFRTSEWNNWINCHCRCLWIHGIPGAGKTVLASYLVARIQQHETPRDQKDTEVATTYYYCYHARNQDEAEPLLRWLVAQLCLKSKKVPHKLLRLFKVNSQPNLADLLTCVEEALSCLKTAFITVDAVDESHTRGRLLAVLRTLATDPRFQKLQLLVTSRQYDDIRRTMERISQPLSMSNPHVEADIRIYVAAKILSTPRFHAWPTKLREEVQESLSEGAKGMFRWAVCQLDILRRCSNIQGVREALKDLPQTLEDAYVRIFSCVPENDWPLLAHAFRIIYAHGQVWREDVPLPPHLVLSSFCTFGSSTTSSGHHFYDIESMKDICGCLITFNFADNDSEYEGARLAHYTVREFLESPRILDTAAAYFHVKEDVVGTLFLHSLIQRTLAVQSYEAFLPTDGLPPEDGRGRLNLKAFPLESYCLISSFTAIQRSGWQDLVAENDTLMAAAVQLFHPSHPSFPSRRRALIYFERFEIGEIALVGEDFWTFPRKLEWMEIPDDSEAVAVIILVFWGLDTLAEKLASTIEASRIGKANLRFSMTSQDFSAGIKDVTCTYEGTAADVLAQCARFRLWGPDGLRAILSILGDHLDQTSTLISYIGSHDHEYCRESCLVEHFLRRGADPNPRGYRVMPLQIAAFHGDRYGVKYLLKAGAFCDAIGEENGLKWDEDSQMGHFYNELHGHSPLYLVRHRKQLTCYVKLAELQVDSKKTEEILLSYGAEEYPEREESKQEG